MPLNINLYISVPVLTLLIGVPMSPKSVSTTFNSSMVFHGLRLRSTTCMNTSISQHSTSHPFFYMTHHSCTAFRYAECPCNVAMTLSILQRKQPSLFCASPCCQFSIVSSLLLVLQVSEWSLGLTRQNLLRPKASVMRAIQHCCGRAQQTPLLSEMAWLREGLTWPCYKSPFKRMMASPTQSCYCVCGIYTAAIHFFVAVGAISESRYCIHYSNMCMYI